MLYFWQESPWPRGRVLGGSSSLNYNQYVRGSRHDYDAWSNEGCKGWSYKEVLPYFIKSENMQIPKFQKSGFKKCFIYFFFYYIFLSFILPNVFFFIAIKTHIKLKLKINIEFWCCIWYVPNNILMHWYRRSTKLFLCD